MFKNVIVSALLLLTLAACGGGDGASIGSGGGGSGGGTGGGGTGGGGTTTTPTYSLGAGAGSSFQSGSIAVAVANLSAGGSTTLQVSIVDQNSALYTTSTPITFSSTCLALGTATITSGSVVGNTVTTTTGSVTVTYTARGCSGADVITASAAAASQSLSATGTVNIAAATIGSIQFISASPTAIGLKGTGLGETSTLIFQVVDSIGGPVPGVDVSFSLNTTVGGLSLSPASATSGADGRVQTVVSAGTAHTSIRVTASIANPARATQSSVLAVTTGLPSSNAFSLAITGCPNIEAYGIDGVQVPITVRLADRYNNPAPNGTSVAFTTSGGHVDGSCVTPSAAGSTDGACVVNWVSANPRPLPSSVPPSLLPGRVMVLATAIGEESFTDANGNGYYDSGEPFMNLGEPYRDDNESSAYESNEYYLDFNGNSARNVGDGVFKGITCTGSTAADTCTTSTLAIGAQGLIVMSTSEAQLGNVTVAAPFSAPVYTASANQNIAIQYTIFDMNGNPMPAKTTVAVTAEGGIGSISASTASYTIPCTTSVNGTTYTSFLVTPTTAPTTPANGNVVIKITSPNGLVSPFFIPFRVN